MKSIFKKIAFVLALALVVTALPAKTAAAAAEPWLKAKRTLYIGGDATEQYADAAWASVKKGDYSVKFASADEKIATVNAKNGRIHAVSVGETVVTATFSKDGAKDIVKECAVKVKQNAGAVELDEKSAEMTVGEKITVKATAENENTTDNIHFAPKAAADKEIIDVDYDNGEITAKAEGSATVLVYATQWEYNKDTKKWAKKVTTDKVEFTVTVKAAEFTAEATGVKEITVTGNFDKDSKFTVKKGNTTVPFTATVAEDGKSAVLALGTKLREATYTVSCGDLSAEFTAEDEQVKNITIFEDNSYVTTNVSRDAIYVHYDVLNQYGESVRKNFDVTWTLSTGTVPTDSKERGMLTIPAKGGTVFQYGNTVIITGIHTQMGNVVPVQATVTVGLENTVGKVNIKGVVKDGSNELLSVLPSDFTDNKYLLVFEMTDRFGYPMAYNDTDAADLSFVSKNPLLIGAFAAAPLKMGGVWIDGVQYGAAKIVRGAQAKNGGVAEITIVSNKTGLQTPALIEVASAQVLESFNLLPYDGTIAVNDGEAYLAYEAFDKEGNPVNNFRVLADAVTFSSNDLKLVKLNDGSASLRLEIPRVSVVEKYTYPAVYTSTVASTGKSSTVKYDIHSTRKAASVAAYNGTTNILEGADITVDLKKNEWHTNGYLTYFDNYDAEIPSWRTDWIGDANCYIAVKGSEAITVTGSAVKTVGDYIYFNYTDHITLQANPGVTESKLDTVVEFALADKATNQIVGGSTKKAVFTIIDLSQCTGFNAWANDNLQYNGQNYSDYGVNANIAGGGQVTIPKTVRKVSGSSIVTTTLTSLETYIVAAPAGATAPAVITGSSMSTLATIADGSYQFKDLSTKLADGSYADRTLTYSFKITIYDLDGKMKDTVVPTLEVGDYAKKNVKFLVNGNKTWINNPTDAFITATSGVITYGDLIDYIDKLKDNYNDDVAKTGTTVTITKLVEGNDGLYDASTGRALTLSANSVSSAQVMILNAEFGDTFTATYTLGDAKIAINFVVGADTDAVYRSSHAGTSLIWR